MPVTSTDESKLIQKKPQVDPVNYNEAELKYRSALIQKLEYAHQKRQYKYPELNDMSYDDYWESNAKAGNSYIMPKRNDQDVRVVTGTTEEKNNTLWSSLLNYNLEPDIEAFDQDDLPIQDLGTICEDMIRKSRKIEIPDHEVKRILIYKELLDQGTVFVEDTSLELQVPKKVLKDMKWREGMAVDKIEWEPRQHEINKFCNSNLITGLNVYLGNIREFYMEYQPYVFIHRIVPRWELEATYGNWERWKNVPYASTHQELAEGATTREYNDWSLQKVEGEMVEEIKFYSYWLNEYMILINGVMMLPIGFPLSGLNGVNIMPVVKGDLAPISRNFAYSKSIPAKTKVDQAVFDEILKLMVLKTRQSFEPPMANNTGQTLSKRILFPGVFTPNVDQTKLQPIITTTGVTAAEFNMAEFVKRVIDEKSVSPVFQGQSTKGNQTAREIVELKQQSLMKMGITILGVLNLEKKLCWNRLNNIIYNWTKPDEDNIYRSMSVDSEFGDGLKGKRIIEFTKKKLPETEQVMAEEEILSARLGQPVRKVYLNPTDLKAIPKYFFIEMTPTERDTSELRKAVFTDTLTAGLQLFGSSAQGGSMNMEYWKARWANVNSEDPEKAFVQQPPQIGQNAMGGQAAMSGEAIGGQTMEQMAPMLLQMQPTVNQLANV